MMTSVADLTRFRTVPVTKYCSIKDFVAEHNLSVKPGRSFYQVKKPETIQTSKEIVAQRKLDEVFLTGFALDIILGLPSSDEETFQLEEDKLEDFNIFIQSTSYNRVLVAGSLFLYEEDDLCPTVETKTCEPDNKIVNNNEPVSSDSKLVTQPEKPGPDIRFDKGSIIHNVGAPGSAGSPLDIVFCFDTTGSMGGCIMEVRKCVKDVLHRLFKDFLDMRLCAFAHGDYIDRHKYVTTFTDFTQDQTVLREWVETVDTTYGGDWEECYELALNEIRTKLAWRPGTQRVVVMIGDAIPHDPHQSEAGLDWEVELDALVNDLGARIYAVQCGTNELAKEFWSSLAERSGGKHLYLHDFAHSVDLLMAICYRELNIKRLKAYEAEVRLRENKKGHEELNSALQHIFTSLREPDSAPSILRPDSIAGKVAVPSPADESTVESSAASPSHTGLDETSSPTKRGRPPKIKVKNRSEISIPSKKGCPPLKDKTKECSGGHEKEELPPEHPSVKKKANKLSTDSKSKQATSAKRGRPSRQDNIKKLSTHTGGEKSTPAKNVERNEKRDDIKPSLARRGRPPLKNKTEKMYTDGKNEKLTPGKRGRPPLKNKTKQHSGSKQDKSNTSKRRRPPMRNKVVNNISNKKVSGSERNKSEEKDDIEKIKPSKSGSKARDMSKSVTAGKDSKVRDTMSAARKAGYGGGVSEGRQPRSSSQKASAVWASLMKGGVKRKADDSAEELKTKKSKILSSKAVSNAHVKEKSRNITSDRKSAVKKGKKAIDSQSQHTVKSKAKPALSKKKEAKNSCCPAKTVPKPRLVKKASQKPKTQKNNKEAEAEGVEKPLTIKPSSFYKRKVSISKTKNRIIGKKAVFEGKEKNSAKQKLLFPGKPQRQKALNAVKAATSKLKNSTLRTTQTPQKAATPGKLTKGKR